MNTQLDTFTKNCIKVLLVMLIIFVAVLIFCTIFVTLTTSVIYGGIVDMITNVHTIVNQ